MLPLNDVRRVHAALAHQLLGTWATCPKAQEAVHTELLTSNARTEESANVEDYLQLLSTRLRTAGAEQLVVDKLDDVAAEYQRVDNHIQYMFEKILALARECYELYASWTVSDVRLEVRSVTNRVYPDRENFGELGAVACVPPRQETDDPAIVKLTFIPSLLGPPSWASVPYLLCHEIVCHVNQAAPMSSDDAFGEGWMDMVALQLHDRWADQIFPWAPALARSAANRLSDTVLRRWTGMHKQDLDARAARSVGREAARSVGDMLGPFLGNSQDTSGLIQLSLQLNRATPTVAGRLAFVSKINSIESGLNLDPGLKAALLARLRLWLQGTAQAETILSFE